MTPLRLLYVDDDDDIRHIVELSLSIDPSITLKVAASAGEALAALTSGWLPDAALLDVMMPGIDGPALLDRLRADPLTAGIPVIFLTAKARPADVARYRERGALGVILKPFDPVTLAAEVRHVLAGGGSAEDAVEQP
jgi:two-component system, OmpR family, response regulator